MPDNIAVVAPVVAAPEVKAPEAVVAPEVKDPNAIVDPASKAEAKDIKDAGIKKDPNAADPNKPYTLKVNGKMVNVTLDQALQFAQKGVGADQKFKEAATMRQQSELLVKLLREDPMSILTDPRLGLDFKKLATEYISKEIERETLTPEQRDAEDTKAKLSKLEAERKQELEQRTQAEQQQLIKYYEEENTKDVMETLETSGLPKSDYTVKRLAHYMLSAYNEYLRTGDKRFENVKAKDVVELVRRDYMNDVKSLFSSSDGDVLEKMLGEDTVKKLMAAQLKKVPSRNKPPAQLDAEVKPLEPKQKMTISEYRDYLSTH